MKRTDLEVWDVRAPFWDGGCCAAAKSGEREALFGEARVAEGLAPLEANCVVRSVSWVLRVESWSWSELESVSLGFEAAGAGGTRGERERERQRTRLVIVPAGFPALRCLSGKSRASGIFGHLASSARGLGRLLAVFPAGKA